MDPVLVARYEDNVGLMWKCYKASPAVKVCEFLELIRKYMFLKRGSAP
jgi:hypothetical protein